MLHSCFKRVVAVHGSIDIAGWEVEEECLLWLQLVDQC